jgi:beta propeller repeat protein
MGRNLTGKFLLVWFLVLAFFIVQPTTAAGTETLITTLNNGMNHQLPKIYGDQIVWQDISGSIGIIYLYNTTSGVETQISDNTDYNYNPAIYGNNVVWTDCGSDPSCSVSKIYLHNISSGITTQISDGTSWQDYPAIYGNRIVWQDSRNPTSQIYINGTSPGLEIQVSATGSTQNAPEIYADNVVWEDCGSNPVCLPNSAIYLYNISSGIKTQISDGSSSQQFPAIYGNRIIWQDNRNSGNYEIFINGTAPGQEYSLSPNADVSSSYPPGIAGTWVSWVQTNTSGNYDIDVNDTGTYTTFPIALNLPGVDLASIAYSPSPSLYRIVWDELDPSGNNVYLYTSGLTETCPLAGFTNNFAGGNAPLTGQFTDTSTYSSSNPITRWFWDFGDGTNSTLENPTHTYSANGAYTASLTVSNSLCRNSTTVTNSVVVGRPVAGFTASPTSGTAPAAITFTNTSLGNPTQWNWSWGDGTWTNGTTSLQLNTVHTYYSTGTYSVSLTTTNSYGSDTLTRTNYITVLAGANVFANSTINGLTIEYHGSQQYLVFDNTTLPNWTFNPNSSVIDFEPPTNRGFQNISIYTSDPGGFQVFSNGSIAGTISSVHLQTNEITPSGFSVSTGGPFCSMNYSIDLPSYPENAVLNTQVWEGATSSDATNFNSIASGSHFAGANGTAYTAEIIKTNFPTGGTAKLYMSVNASLVASKPYGRNEVFVERIVDGGQQGEVLGTHYLNHDSSKNLDYFEADSPDGLSTFGLSFLEGGGNLFQLITLTVSSQVASSSSGYSGGGGGGPSSNSYTGAPAAVQNPAVPQAAAPQQPDLGKTVNLYLNANNVIDQATTLQSNDNLASLSIGQGIIAEDASGKALSSVTITRENPTNVPSATTGSAYSFAGMAYNLQPSGATFSPAITLTFTIPEAQWGKEYTVQSFDPTTNAWQDLPTTYDASKGTISAQVSHFCCFALFAKPVASALPGGAPAGAPPKAVPTLAPPAPTAMSIFVGMILWISDTVTGHVYLVAIAVIAGIALLFTQQRRRRRRRDPLL